ncbi:hypothetical protein [Radiobacillus sp. PE A8.2]|uniref:hypothetical protein n=1 Tax=Radiobacillus sp. PE A8.2 TaxID=3380349 RepID=UPI00388EF19F
MFLVIGTFDWIGYHLTQVLLDKGEQVIGLDKIETEKQENLQMFIGRNSSFQHVKSKQELENHKKYDEIKTVINVDNRSLDSKGLQTKRCFKLVNQALDDDVSGYTQVEIPLLYGEWMNRTEDGIEFNGNYIEFESEIFRNQAIYIEDFVYSFVQILNQDLGHIVKCKSLTKDVRDENDSENTIYIPEKELMKDRLEKCNKHYQQFSFLYDN